MPLSGLQKLKRFIAFATTVGVMLFCMLVAGDIYAHPFSWNQEHTLWRWVSIVIGFAAVAALAVWAKKKPGGAPVAAGIWTALGAAILLTGICATG